MNLWQRPLATAIILGAAAFSAPETAVAQQIKIDGSSTVFPIMEAVAEEFQIAKRGKVRVTVGIAGTGGGFKKFCRGETDVSNASRPILAEEIAACKAAGVRYIELPVAFDALTVVVNNKNTWARTLTVAELKKIWEPAAQGRITRWSQVRAGFPNQPIQLFGAGSDSGTFDYFTEAVNGKSKLTRTDYTASEDDNTLVQGVENNANALGYFGYAYYINHKARMSAVAVHNGKAAVLPSEANVVNGTYTPLSRPLFIYIRDSAANRPEVAEFVKFILTKGAPLVREVGYVALPPQAYAQAQKHFDSRRYGSVFGGVPEVGITIEELMAREAK